MSLPCCHPENPRTSVLEATGLKVAPEVMRVVGVPMSPRDYPRRYIGDFIRCQPAPLARALVPLEDAQTRYQILCFPAASKLSLILCLCSFGPFLPKLLGRSRKSNADRMEKSIDHYGKASHGYGPPDTGQSLQGHTGSKSSASLWTRSNPASNRLPLHEGGHGHASTVNTGGAAYLGRKVLVVARKVTSSSGTSPRRLLRLPNVPLIEVLIEKLKGVASYI